MCRKFCFWKGHLGFSLLFGKGLPVYHLKGPLELSSWMGWPKCQLLECVTWKMKVQAMKITRWFLVSHFFKVTWATSQGCFVFNNNRRTCVLFWDPFVKEWNKNVNNAQHNEYLQLVLYSEMQPIIDKCEFYWKPSQEAWSPGLSHIWRQTLLCFSSHTARQP